MRIISKNPVYIDSNEKGTMYSQIDGSSTPAEIKAFQNYVEAKHEDYATKVGYGQYGKWDRLTGDAWKKFGVEYDALKVGKKTKEIVKEVETETKKVKEDVDKVKKDLEKEKAKGEKGWNGLPKGAKIGIIAGGGALLVTILIIAFSGSKAK